MLLAGSAALLLAAPAHAQLGMTWQRVPRVTVISADAADPRHALVEEAIAFWNRALEEMGSGFRLGPVMRVVAPVPENALKALSDAVPTRQRGMSLPAELHGVPGDLIIVLASSDFVSFASRFFETKRIVGIKGAQHWPLTLPNVSRNLIAHEIGHAIGLGHNADPTLLMCGRPAPCRPDLFRSDEPRWFPLGNEEKRRLRSMYPADWKPGD